METVFISIHDLSLDARIKYVSDSVEDILGYLPRDVKGKSCWEYFHPDEIPFARAIHGRGIHLDKAAQLNYCRIKHKDGTWIGCECVFTIVYDVIVASTSIYRRSRRSRQRAIEAPAIRRIFSSSPRDPRYHMLSYISSRFSQGPKTHSHEPRAALFLNRFTRTSPIMFATSGVANILGINPEQLTGKSFYFCISENCLQDAVSCLESAKANDSIAYLRFWYRNPMQDDERNLNEAMVDGVSSSDEDEDDGGVPIARREDTSDTSMQRSHLRPAPPLDSVRPSPRDALQDGDNPRSSSENSADMNNADGIFDAPATAESSASSLTPVDESVPPSPRPLEIEAVVSCTSDGLVVVLRHARPLVPQSTSRSEGPAYPNGLFASPWATEPMLPDHVPDHSIRNAPPAPVDAIGSNEFMSTIRDVAVFAWSLTGINGTLAEHGRGRPVGESLPPGGLPVWDPATHADPDNIFNGFAHSTHRPQDNLEPVDLSKVGQGSIWEGVSNRGSQKSSDELPDGFQDRTDSGISTDLPDCVKKIEKDNLCDGAASSSSSEDEVVWKRAPQMSEWRKPTRRAYQAAFGSDGDPDEAQEKAQHSPRKRAAH